MIPRSLLVRLGTVSLLSALLLVGLSVPLGPLPPLGGLLEPRGGFWTTAQDALPVARQTLAFPGLEAPVEVYRDEYYVPHIFAESDGDLFRAVGYLQAQDRLFQMDLQRRAATGNLSEVLGARTLETDRFFRSIGMNWAVERTLAAYDPETRAVLEAYADGVNAYLGEASPHRLPLEFKLLDYEPRPWTPADTVAFGKLMGWVLSGSFEDLELKLFLDAYGAEAAADLFPVDMPLQIPIVRPGPGLSPPAPTPASPDGGDLKGEAIREILRRAAAASPVLARFEMPGSNNWAVAPSKSVTGAPLLANDPHLSLDLPSIWYQMRLRSPTLNVYGAALLGAPAVILGFNEDIAWGFTNVGADVVDFYVERINRADPTLYRHQNEWKSFEFREEVIRVRGAEPVPVQLNITVHGPMIAARGQNVSIQWTGHEPTFEIRALLNLSRASGWGTFRAALEDFHVPAQNVVYADVAGNIGIVVNGLYPLRNPDCPAPQPLGRLPLNGSSGACDWVGFVPMEDVPAEFNPVRGFVLSANQKPTGPLYDHYLGWSWADRYRAERIQEVLEARDDHSVATLQALQLDHLSTAARAFVPLLVEAFDDAGTAGPLLHPQAEDAVDLLREWNFVMDRNRVEPTLYWLWLRHYRDATFRDEWDAAELSEVGLPSVTVLEWLSTDPERRNSSWFDDVTTSGRETRDDVLLQALVDTLEFLKTRPLTEWRWGRVHQIEFRHLLQLDALGRGPVPRDGGSFTVDVAHGSLRDGQIRVTSGPSWRLVVDLRTPVTARGVHPGGQSGNPLSPHYTDLLLLWREGEYQTLALPTEAELAALQSAPASGRGY